MLQLNGLVCQQFIHQFDTRDGTRTSYLLVLFLCVSTTVYCTTSVTLNICEITIKKLICHWLVVFSLYLLFTSVHCSTFNEDFKSLIHLMLKFKIHFSTYQEYNRLNSNRTAGFVHWLPKPKFIRIQL